MKKIILFSTILLFFVSCTDLSEGQRRRKLEFLYKLNNEASILRDYTYRIHSYEDLEFYKGRLEKSEEATMEMDLVKNWNRSDELREIFLMKIKENKETTDSLIKDEEKINDEEFPNNKKVVGMKMKMDDFVDFIYKEISIVDKE